VIGLRPPPSPADQLIQVLDWLQKNPPGSWIHAEAERGRIYAMMKQINSTIAQQNGALLRRAGPRK